MQTRPSEIKNQTNFYYSLSVNAKGCEAGINKVFSGKSLFKGFTIARVAVVKQPSVRLDGHFVAVYIFVDS